MNLKYDNVCTVEYCENSTNEYFKEEHAKQCICISSDKPDIDEIIDIFVHPEIISTKLLETKDGLSNEGQKLTGYKLLVQVKLNEKITYISNDNTQNICVVYYEVLKSIFIILPKSENGKSISDMYKFSRIVVSPTIEDCNARKLNCRTLDANTLILLQAKIC